MNEALSLLLRLNLAAAAAIVLVLALRGPARRLFGPGVAYGLWSLAPLAVIAMLVPARVVTLTDVSVSAWPTAAAAAAPKAAAMPSAPVVSVPLLLAGLWLAGAAFAAGRIAWRQRQFARAMRAGTAGPAVVGVLKPRIVTPDDFARRYSARERELVLVHEATHLARQDSRVNAAVALVRCLAWFNPFVHALAHCLRIDQELACDAQVVARFPAARRAYAEAMLKTQLSLQPLPLGCYWPASGVHPLAQRIALLARPAPGRSARALGLATISLAAIAVAGGAWAARPTAIRWIAAPAMPAAATPVMAQAKPEPAPTPRPHAERRPTLAPAPAVPVAVAEPAAQPVSSPVPPEGCGQPDDGQRRRLAPGDFGPARRIHSSARWSSVEPGTAVRVYATATDPTGVPLITDLTAFGSQSWYRVGCIRRNPSPEKLFTSVVQHGDRLTVRASIQTGAGWIGPTSIDLKSGETGAVTLPDGRKVAVTALARPETPEELEAARGAQPNGLLARVVHFPLDG